MISDPSTDFHSTTNLLWPGMVIDRCRSGQYLYKGGMDIMLSVTLKRDLKSKTRCSAIAERPHCRVRYSFGQKWKTGTGRQYFTDIIGLSSTTVI